MGQFTLIKRNGTRIPLNKRIPFCAVKTAQQSRSLMADDTVTLEVVSTFLIDFEKGDKIKIDSDWYTIRTTVDRTKNSEDQYNYSITLYGCIYDLMKVMFRDTDVNGRSTSLTFDLTYSIKDFVKVIIYNMNRDYPGEWVFDDKDCPETEPKTVSFSCQNCLQTLQNECKDFDVDFQITTDKDGIHHIKIGKFGSVVTPPNGEKYFQWGRGHGLFTLVEGKVDDKAIITRMYGEGGTNNIPTAYRDYSERLQLPYPQRLNKHDHKLSDGTVVKAKTMQIGCTDDNKRYIEDAALSKKIGVEEDAIQNDDIYPRRTGKVTALGDDVYTFMDDTMDFDLKASNSNGTTYLIDGTSAKITFITGRLAGREFELHDYDHSTKKFILKPYKDARGLVFPTSNTTAFQIREGDQYKITDIIMPDSYIEDAEEDLWFYVYDKFLQAKQARAQYALTFSRSYFIENMPKDSNSCLFTPGDYVPIKDERFNLEKNIRIQKVERNLLLRHDYTLTISDTATISIINQAVINVQKHDTILEANRLKDLTRAKYGWRTTEELRNMIYDPDGYFDTDNIKPNSIDTNMLTVGSKSQQFVLADVIMQANLGGDPNLFKATSGTLCHLSISDTDIRYWKIAALEATLSEAGGYYLFAKCSKKGDTGSWYLTQEQLKFEPTSDPNNYYFQVGVLSSVYDASWRDFATTYGFTRINGNTITTGKIVTSDGYCYLDLDGNKFRMGDKQSYIDYNVQQRGQITLHNVRLLSTSGDSSEIGVYRGEYNASYVYYKGDEVTYTNNGVTATYRYIYSEPTKGYAPTVGTYWQCIAKGKDGEKGTPGAPGEDGRTSYTHFKYSNDGGLSFTGNNGEEPGSYLGQYTDFEEMDSSDPTRYTWALIQGEAGNSGVDAAASSYFECRYAKNGSTVEPPTLDATALEPTGWSLQMPSVGKLEYLWMSMAQKSKLVEQTYCHIPFTAKDGCKDITGNYSTELGSGGSIVTEGDRQFLSLPDDSDLRIKYDLPFGENFTIFFWFKTDQKKIGWAIQDAAFTLNMKEMDVKPGTWMHLAFRFSDRTVSCFLNGVRQATASLNKKLIGFTVYDSNMYASANCYDEFRMVNGALADVDIVKVYQDKADKLLSNWSVPTRISPYDGKDGVSIMARYSSDKQNWHTSFQTGDQWMQTSSDSGKTWGEACKIVGEAGTNGKYTDYSFATSKDLTTKDVFTSPRIYTTWSDAPVATTKDYPYLWMKVVEVDSNGKKSQARYTRLTGDPGKDGVDGVDSKYIYLRGTGMNRTADGQVTIYNGTKTETITCATRGLTLVRVDRSSLAVLETYKCDTYSNVDSTLTAFAKKIKAYNSECFICLVSYDAVAWNDSLIDALKYCGGTDLHNRAQGRYPFAFLGIPGMAQGYAQMIQSSDSSSAPYAEISAYIANRMFSTAKAVEETCRLDLSNENETVTCDSSGNVIGSIQGTQATLYKGSSVVSGIYYSCSASGCCCSFSTTTGKATNIDMSSNKATLKISCTYDGVTYSAVYTISKVYPGKDGSDAVSRYLELSCTSVKVDKSGNVSPSKITAKQMKQVGGKAPENTTDLYLVGLASSKSTATQLKAKSITINVSSSDTWVDFTLKDGSGNVYDTERVPVVKDGKDGTNGTNGKDGTNGTNGKDGAPGTPGKDGAPGTPGKDGRDGIDGKDGRDGTDGYSLAPIYRGEYSESKTYYGTQYRVDIVKYNGIYYVARVDAGTFSNVAPTNTSKWNPFGAQFESIATNLLLAEGANIGDWFLSGGKIVSTLSTTYSGKITLDAKGGLIQVESAISGGDHSQDTTMGAKITLDANRGVIQATAKNAPSYSTGTAYMSPSGIFANMAGTGSISPETGMDHRSAIVGLGSANVSKSVYGQLNTDEKIVAGVYGMADNVGTAPAYGGYFWDLKACGLILNTKLISDNSSYNERCLSNSVSFVIGLCNKNVVKDVYLPNDTKIGRIIKFKQMGAGAMRVRPKSGQHIYDDTSENDYYDCGEGQCLEFVFCIWVKGSTTTNVWTVSKYKF